jgi:hypothetical protein
MLTCCGDDKIVNVAGELRDNRNSLLAKAKGEFIIIRGRISSPGFKESEKEIFNPYRELEKNRENRNWRVERVKSLSSMLFLLFCFS